LCIHNLKSLKAYLGPFGSQDRIEIEYDIKLDKDRKWYRQNKHLSYQVFDAHMITNIISYISQLNDKISPVINYMF